MFTRILVPTDFSEPSDAALDYARVSPRSSAPHCTCCMWWSRS